MKVTETLANLFDPCESSLSADQDIGGAEVTRTSPMEGTPRQLRALPKSAITEGGRPTSLKRTKKVKETFANSPDPRETGLPADQDIGGAKGTRTSPMEGTPRQLRALQLGDVARAGKKQNGTKSQKPLQLLC
ncbi:hypothetical protein BLNAU_20155 [Blattamonas nauphoetae]|uniref:Uncharacterized protein n=1 Tax=Blattamonas nauphoetae TaxID=2049346 RepID=A0ABQ9WZH4_9EUKA|nr:hypothetical protein BLNAU_20155 [Blattamonas nauphoetae]